MSAFTLAEVYTRKCSVIPGGIASDQDVQLEEFIMQDCVIIAQLDMDVGTAARRLLRSFPEIGKPQDAIHVATALLNSIDELHIFDRADLLGLNNTSDRIDGVKLRICPPSAPPSPPPRDAQTNLFEESEQQDAGKEDDQVRGQGRTG